MNVLRLRAQAGRWTPQSSRWTASTSTHSSMAGAPATAAYSSHSLLLPPWPTRLPWPSAKLPLLVFACLISCIALLAQRLLSPVACSIGWLFRRPRPAFLTLHSVAEGAFSHRLCVSLTICEALLQAQVIFRDRVCKRHSLAPVDSLLSTCVSQVWLCQGCAAPGRRGGCG